MYVYEVRTTKAIAKEMCRYDDAQITTSTLVREAPAFALAGADEATIEQFRKYRFTIKSQRQPTTARWSSFGVRIRNLRKE